MYKKIGDLMYENENLEETVQFCKVRNAIIFDTPDDKLVNKFLQQVEENSGGLTSSDLDKHVGTMRVAYNSYYVIDPFIPNQLTLPMEPGIEPGTHVINFFVRMGRKPLSSTGEKHKG